MLEGVCSPRILWEKEVSRLHCDESVSWPVQEVRNSSRRPERSTGVTGETPRLQRLEQAGSPQGAGPGLSAK